MTTQDTLSGTLFAGRYRVTRKLGGGGMAGGAIFLALVALLWLTGTRIGRWGPALSPTLAFLAAVALLGAIFHVSGGTLP